MTASVSQVLSEAADREIDAEVARIMAMSDDEIMREADADDAAWARGFKLGLASGHSAITRATKPYLVWSNEHQAWWGPEHRGYTRHIERAGRYERAEAMSIAGKREGGWHVRKGNPDEIAIPERDAIEQYAAITAALAKEQGR